MPETIDPTAAREPYSAERCVLRLVRTYVNRRVEAKHGLTYKGTKEDESTKGQFNEARHKVAKDAFLAVRSRTGEDFIAYFASTLCAVPQFLPEEDFIALMRDLHGDPDKIRTLTLVSLSAQG